MEEVQLIQGVGVGLRSPQVERILGERPNISWFEVVTDNYLSPGGLALKELEEIRDHYPITMHSVGVSLGSTDELDLGYLSKLKILKERFNPGWVSEHLCWSSVHGVHLHDLLPLPYTEESVWHVAERIRRVQDFLNERILIENVSSYLSFSESTMSEAEFVRAVVTSADCYLLLDLNNVYVNQRNHGTDGRAFVRSLPLDRVKEIHLGGHEDRGDYTLDSHADAVSDEVWSLYQDFVGIAGQVPTLIEWDNDIPELSVLMREASIAQAILNG